MIYKISFILAGLWLTACGGGSDLEWSSAANTAPAVSTNECSDPRVDFPNKAIVEEVCRRTNDERKAVGLGPLILNLPLSQVAQAHAEDMVKRNFFSHTNPDGQSPFDRMNEGGISYSAAAENIAYFYKTPEEVMSAWMDSSGHRTNILGSRYGKIGIGFYQNYWVQDFTN